MRASQHRALLKSQQLLMMLAGLLLMSVGETQTPGFTQVSSRKDDLTGLSLEELSEVPITFSTFARRPENLWETPAAVFVITRDDIEASAASTIPDLLRRVPGLQVAQINASTWAVSARGFNSAAAEKLLVLVDGRSLYSEIYSGAHWDNLDVPLQEIERIEVIRGPGASVWGWNAVNGVINIITRRARGTTGQAITARVGSGMTRMLWQYGDARSPNQSYRVFGDLIYRDPFRTTSGATTYDGEELGRVGGRYDLQTSSNNILNAAADFYAGHRKQQVVNYLDLPVSTSDREQLSGGFLLGRFAHTSGTGASALQFYYDDQFRHELGTSARTKTLDLDYQMQQVVGERHDLVWGSEARFTQDNFKANPLPFTRSHFRDYLLSGFVQDAITIVPQKVNFTLGTKLQAATLAGAELQPTARLLWLMSKKQVLWAALSRAAVSPSLEDKYLTIPLKLGTYQGLALRGVFEGNPEFHSETMVSGEVGYRLRFSPGLSLDAAAFTSAYADMQSLQVQAPEYIPSTSPYLSTTLLYVNGYKAHSAGVELSTTWKHGRALSNQVAYAWMQTRTNQTLSGNVSLIDEWNTPRNSFSDVFTWALGNKWLTNASANYVGALHGGSTTSVLPAASAVQSYLQIDAHVSRELSRGFRVDLGGQNLVRAQHQEFSSGTDFNLPYARPRDVYVRGTWVF